MLKLFIGKDAADVKIFKFPAGESGVSYSWDNSRTRLETELSGMITLCWEGNEDLIHLALLVDAIRRDYSNICLSLEMPYFCYARQDRVCDKGESLSVKVIAELINSLNFARVYVIDPHSDVLGAVLNNMVVPNLTSKVAYAVDTIGGRVALVSPDAGANKKVFSYAKALNGLAVIRADKTRNTATGAITGTTVLSEHLGDVNLLVVDDICDGGYTFIALAVELRKITHGTISLLVSHGIFTKGVDVVANVYDNVFVINNMFGAHPLIKEIN